MKLVVQFFNEKEGTRSDPVSGSSSEILEYFDRIENMLRASVDEHRSFLDCQVEDFTGEKSADEIRAEHKIYLDNALYSLDRFLDSFVIVILEQHSDDPEDMKVSRMPILKRENFIKVLEEKAQ
ncbi:MAG: hypothetical protein QXT77_07980 [Candidatus Methanomethylicaceae archaeon]